ncbi:MAG: translation elongation factor Ts [Parcubacteria group bacterium]|nr:translation elongation factor Ts [Parcubacteria group bacterium]
MSVDIKAVSELRSRTGAGLMDAKKTLEAADGDIEKAIDMLRKAGAAKAAKKAERETKEGVVEYYVHSNGKVGTMVVLTCETDFVARNEKFRQLARDIAMHVAAANPEYLRVEDVPASVTDKEKDIYKEQLRTQGKPEAMLDQIAQGKLGKFYEEKVLLKQPFIKDEEKTIEQLIEQAIAIIGEKIELTRFVRLAV